MTIKSICGQIEDVLDTFDTVSLADLSQTSLLNRFDTKFVMPLQTLYPILSAVSHVYRVLRMNGELFHGYRSLYFDTTDFDLYYQHHNQRRPRWKARSRQYLSNNQAFFELKAKCANGRTSKQRMPTTTMVTAMTPETEAFLALHAPELCHRLQPKLWSEYRRATLIDPDGTERITIDTDLCFRSRHRMITFDHLAIVELKKTTACRTSPILQHLRAAGTRPRSFSKYCVGLLSLYPSLKHNMFKPSLRLIERIREVSYV